MLFTDEQRNEYERKEQEKIVKIKDEHYNKPND